MMFCSQLLYSWLQPMYLWVPWCWVLCGSQQLLVAGIQQGLQALSQSLVCTLGGIHRCCEVWCPLHPVGSAGTSHQPIPALDTQPGSFREPCPPGACAHCKGVWQSELSSPQCPGQLPVPLLPSLPFTVEFAAAGFCGAEQSRHVLMP